MISSWSRSRAPGALCCICLLPPDKSLLTFLAFCLHKDWVMGGGWGLFYFSFAFSRGIVSILLETCSQPPALRFVSFGLVQDGSSEGISPSGSLVMNILWLEKAGATAENNNIQFHWAWSAGRAGSRVLPGLPSPPSPRPHHPTSPATHGAALCFQQGSFVGTVAQLDININCTCCPPWCCRQVMRSDEV